MASWPVSMGPEMNAMSWAEVEFVSEAIVEGKEDNVALNYCCGKIGAMMFVDVGFQAKEAATSRSWPILVSGLK